MVNNRIRTTRALAVLAPAPIRQVGGHVEQLHLPAFAQRELQAANRRREEETKPMVGKMKKRAPGDFAPLAGGERYEERLAAWEERQRQRQQPVPAPRRPQRAPRGVQPQVPVPQQVPGNVVAPYHGHLGVQGGFGDFQQFPQTAAVSQQHMQAPMSAGPLQPQWLGDFQGPFSGYQDPFPHQMQAPEPVLPDQQEMAWPVADLQAQTWQWNAAAVPTGNLPVAPAMGPFNMPWGGTYLVAPAQQFNAAAPAPGYDPGFNMAEAMPMSQVPGHFAGPAQQFHQAVLTPGVPPTGPAQGLLDIHEVTGDLQAMPSGPVRPQAPQSESPPDPPAALSNGASASSSSSQPSLGEVMTPPEDEALRRATAEIAAFAATNGEVWEYADDVLADSDWTNVDLPSFDLATFDADMLKGSD